jgi:hypothetical protein
LERGSLRRVAAFFTAPDPITPLAHGLVGTARHSKEDYSRGPRVEVGSSVVGGFNVVVGVWDEQDGGVSRQGAVRKTLEAQTDSFPHTAWLNHTHCTLLVSTAHDSMVECSRGCGLRLCSVMWLGLWGEHGGKGWGGGGGVSGQCAVRNGATR